MTALRDTLSKILLDDYNSQYEGGTAEDFHPLSDMAIAAFKRLPLPVILDALGIEYREGYMDRHLGLVDDDPPGDPEHMVLVVDNPAPVEAPGE